MKNVGIIAEYNPLHNGHLYHMSRIDEDANIIVAMSGNFTERGDTAIMNKYTRARLAVEHGASMVIEIPTLGVLSCAEHYAECAIKSLSLLGNVDTISFGSENGNIDELRAIAMSEESDEIKSNIKKNLGAGMSYPRALANALSDIPNAEDTLSNPNNILGIEYIRACENTGIIPTTIRREGAGYNDKNIDNTKYASATSIRENLISQDIEKYLPKDVLTLARKHSINNDIIFHNLYQKLVVEDADITGILGIGEGIDNRIKNALLESNDYATLLENIKTKRYTLSRIKRTLLSILLDIENTLPQRISDIDYVTVLAVRRDKLALLSHASAQVITKYNDYKKTSHPFSVLDLRADRLYSLLSTDKISSHQMQILDI